MKEVMYYPNFNQDALYNMKDIVEKFPEYFGISLVEMSDLFQNCPIISEKELRQYIKTYPHLMREVQYNQSFPVEQIIQNRLKDYEFFQKTLAILSQKGLVFLSLIDYISNLKIILEDDEQYEKILEQLQIFHYCSIVKGSDMNQLLLTLSYLMKEFSQTLEKINNFSTYHQQTIDEFSRNYGGNRIYPSQSLRLKPGEKIDKTSLMPLPPKTFKPDYKSKYLSKNSY